MRMLFIHLLFNYFNTMFILELVFIPVNIVLLSNRVGMVCTAYYVLSFTDVSAMRGSGASLVRTLAVDIT